MSKINKIRLSGTDYDIQDVSATSVVEVTQQQYDDLPASAKTDNILYIITDSTVDYVTSAQTQSAITQAVSGKVDTSTYAAYTAATDTALANKQTTLTAGTGIAITNNVISTTGGGNSVVELTQAAYDALVTGGTVDPDTFYIITDAQAGDLTNYYTKTETDNAITAATSTKQDTLVSGTNIKTINNESLLGSGNIDIQGGGGGKAVSGGTNISITTGETADTINCTLNAKNGTNGGIIVGDSECTAKGLYGISLGHSSDADGEYSFCNGSNSYARGQMSFAYGDGCGAKHNYAFMIGQSNISTKPLQYSFGSYVKPKNNLEFGFGTYNNSSSASTTFGHSGNTLFSIGNGYDYSSTHNWHNALEIRQNGDIYIANTNDTSITGDKAYSLYPMIKLQDALGSGGSSYTAGDGINISNENVISVTGKVDTSAITTSVTSSSTDAQVPSAKAVNDKLGGLKLVKLTQSAYDALAPNYDSNTLYVING